MATIPGFPTYTFTQGSVTVSEYDVSYPLTVTRTGNFPANYGNYGVQYVYFSIASAQPDISLPYAYLYMDSTVTQATYNITINNTHLVGPSSTYQVNLTYGQGFTYNGHDYPTGFVLATIPVTVTHDNPFVWKTGLTGPFEDASRWVGGVVPTATNSATITAANTTPADNYGDTSHYYARANSDITVTNLSIGSTAGLDISSHNTVTVLNNLTNAGNIEATHGNFLRVNGSTQNTGKIETSSDTTATFIGNVTGGGALTSLGGTIHVEGNTDNVLEVAGTISIDGSASGNVIFHDGGILRIGSTALPTAEIKFFNVGDKIDLAGIPYDSSGTTSINGSQLTINENGQHYHLNFDSLTFSSAVTVKLSADDHGGTVVDLAPIPKTSVERFFDSATGDHFYTLSPAEASQIRATLPTYHDEGAPWSTPDKGTNTIDVFRFFDAATGTHFLTNSVAERDQVLATQPSYHYEGVAFEAYTSPGTGTLTLERFFNTISHLHTYAASAAETASILSGGAGPGWVDEGAGFIVHT